jgi:prevent-host-death family protein
MPKTEATTKTTNLSDAANRLADLLGEVGSGKTRVLIEDAGVLVAAIVPVADVARLVQLDRDRAERFTIVDELREAFQGVSAEEIERETDRIIARLRAEDAARRAEEQEPAGATRR